MELCDEAEKAVPWLIFKSHVVRDETNIKYICGSLEFCALKFVVDMRGCFDGVASNDSVVIP